MKQLVREGGIDALLAAVLATSASGGLSIVIVSPSARAGKSTLLRALLDYAPLRAELIYLRGPHDPLPFLDKPIDTSRWDRRLLVANELSPHLPFYVWGETARRALDLADRPGYALWATAHAAVPDECRALWQSCSGTRAVRGEFVMWDPVVVSLKAESLHGFQGWTELTLHVGDLTVGCEVGGTPRFSGDTTPYPDHHQVCHALWNQAGVALRDAFGQLNRLEASVVQFIREFGGVDSAPANPPSAASSVSK